MEKETQEKLSKKDFAFWLLIFPAWFFIVGSICTIIGVLL